ncbi:MAG: hypothetical protein HN531_01460 [Opitutae bacterium]|nr:hypothetical protein [Opitutae bacterium]
MPKKNLYGSLVIGFVLLGGGFSPALADGNATGVSAEAPSVSFYAGVGEGAIGEDPHAVHGTQTSDGGYVVGGKSLDAGGAWDGFLFKVVPSGFSGYLNLQEPGEGNQSYAWSATFGTSSKKDGVNNLASVGDSVFAGGFISVVDGSQDAILAKYSSSDGSKIWEYVLPEITSGLSSAYEVVSSTPDGGLITGGLFDSAKDGLEGFKSYGNPISGKAFVAYYSSSQVSSSVAPSSPSWRKDFNASLTVKGVRPIGSTGDFILLTSLVESPHIPSLKRLDSQGNLLWEKTYPTRSEPTDVCVLASDGTLTGFAFCGHGGKSSGILDSYLTVVDLNGTVRWTREFGDPAGGVGKFAGISSGNAKLIYDESWGIQSTADGGMLVATGTGIEGCEPWQGSDSNQTRIAILQECVVDPRTDWRGMITKFDANGTQVWQRVDSFMPPEGGNASSSACEYVVLLADGKILSVNDEAFGVGLLVLEPEANATFVGDLLASSGTDAGNSWKNSSWMGYFLSFPSGWKYHSTLGWIYSIPTSLDSVWFYDQALGWCWTSQSAYPFLWRHSASEWIYFLKTSSPRSFYDYSDNAWKKL